MDKEQIERWRNCHKVLCDAEDMIFRALHQVRSVIDAVPWEAKGGEVASLDGIDTDSIRVPVDMSDSVCRARDGRVD